MPSFVYNKLLVAVTCQELFKHDFIYYMILFIEISIFFFFATVSLTCSSYFFTQLVMLLPLPAWIARLGARLFTKTPLSNRGRGFSNDEMIRGFPAWRHVPQCFANFGNFSFAWAALHAKYHSCLMHLFRVDHGTFCAWSFGNWEDIWWNEFNSAENPLSRCEVGNPLVAYDAFACHSIKSWIGMSESRRLERGHSERPCWSETRRMGNKWLWRRSTWTGLVFLFLWLIIHFSVCLWCVSASILKLNFFVVIFEVVWLIEWCSWLSARRREEKKVKIGWGSWSFTDKGRLIDGDQIYISTYSWGAWNCILI